LLEDGVLLSLLEPYLDVLAGPDRQRVKLTKDSEFTVESGRRYVIGTVQKPVPSTITIPGTKTRLRLWHEGQTATCWECQQPGHESRSCPQKSRTNNANAWSSRSGADAGSSQLGVSAQTSAWVSDGTGSSGAGADALDAEQAARAEHTPPVTDGLPNAGLDEPTAECQKPADLPNSAAVLSTPPVVSEKAAGDVPADLPNSAVAISTPTTFANSRGKAQRESPDTDEEGFTVMGRGRHSFKPEVLIHNFKKVFEDPQVVWAKEASAKEMQRLERRVAARRGSF